MSLEEQIYAQALLMAGQLPQRDRELCQVLSQSAAACMRRRLRPGLTENDCRADLVAAGALFALAALAEAGSDASIAQLRAGDVTVRHGSGSAAAACLRYQAELILAPYCQDTFFARGV